MKKLAFAAAMTVLGAFALGANAATLTTSFNSNNGQRGIMFDVSTGGSDLDLTAFRLNLYNGSFPMAVYYREGGSAGYLNDPTSWTLLDRTSIVSAGTDRATYWDVADLRLSANTTYGLYVTNMRGGGVNYINGTGVGNVAATDGFLTIHEGYGREYPFGVTFQPRIFSGSIEYNAVAPIPLPASLPMMLLGLAGLGVIRSRRSKA